MQRFYAIFLLIGLAAMYSQAFAHKGYNLIAKDIEVSANSYQVSIYEDTHLLENQPHLSLFVQVSQNNQAPNTAPLLTIDLEQSQHNILRQDLRNVGIATDDGSTLYQAYILEASIPEIGLYDAILNMEIGDAVNQYPFQLNAQIQPDFQAIELIPSLVFILLPLLALAVIFLSPYLTRKEHIYAKETCFNHS